MTAEEMKTTVKHHRRSALAGGLLGLALLVAYGIYHFAMTPGLPDLKTATAAEVVAFVGNERGLGRMPQIEQQQFMMRWRDALMEDAGKKDGLRDCLQSLDDESRKAFTEAMFRHLKRAFLDDAKLFKHTPPEKQFDFLKKRLDEGRAQLLLIKEATAGLKSDLPGNQDEFQGWLLKNTTAEERAWGEPYYNALKHVRTQVEKGERTSQPTSGQAGKP